MGEPKLLALLLCEDVRIEDGGQYTLIRTLDMTFVSKLPDQTPVKVFTKIQGGLPSVFEAVHTQVATGREMLRAIATINPGRPSVTYSYVFPLTLVADQFGDYKVTIVADGVTLGSTPWIVRPLFAPEES